jgi:hypothetical protein
MFVTVGPTDSNRPQRLRDSTKDCSKVFKFNRFRPVALNNVKSGYPPLAPVTGGTTTPSSTTTYTSLRSVISSTCVAAITYPAPASLYLLSRDEQSISLGRSCYVSYSLERHANSTSPVLGEARRFLSIPDHFGRINDDSSRRYPASSYRFLAGAVSNSSNEAFAKVAFHPCPLPTERAPRPRRASRAAVRGVRDQVPVPVRSMKRALRPPCVRRSRNSSGLRGCPSRNSRRL